MPLRPRLTLSDVLAVANTIHYRGLTPLDPETEIRDGKRHEHLSDATLARAFLKRLGAAVPPGLPRPAHLAAMRDVRAAARALAVRDTAAYHRALGRILAGGRYRVESAGRVVSDSSGWDGFIGDLALALIEASELMPRMRTCADPDCQWLYVDRSKNQSRKWCEAAVCGNRLNARRWRRRQAGRAARRR